MSVIVFDIETGPRPEAEIIHLFPIEKVKGCKAGAINDPLKFAAATDEELAALFDPASVKLGVRQKPEAKEEKIKADREKFINEAKAACAKVDEARREWLADAALSATTGEVLAIGIKGNSDPILWIDDERAMLAKFWEFYAWAKGEKRTLCGHYIKRFDLPFLIRRSWKHGLTVPKLLERSRFFDELFVDTAEVWAMGGGEYISLDAACKFFGLAGKNGDGAEFASLLKSDRAKAEAYLRNDLEQNQLLALAMGIA